jgi:hypothetical protein
MSDREWNLCFLGACLGLGLTLGLIVHFLR